VQKQCGLETGKEKNGPQIAPDGAPYMAIQITRIFVLKALLNLSPPGTIWGQIFLIY
jgi:hypothetical protein